jgi:hypothetical protein
MKNLQFYKPNKSNTGHACSFWVNEDGTLNCSFIKQSGWNEKTRTGQFSANKDNPNGRVISKLSEIEAAAIVSSIRRKTPLNLNYKGEDGGFYHKSEKQILRISFKSMYDKENAKKHIGYSFTINKEAPDDSTNKSSFYIMLTHGEAELLAIYLEKAVNESFNGTSSYGNNKNYTKKVDKTSEKTNIKEASPQEEEADISEEFDDDDDW